MSKARDLANAGTALTTVSATELGYLDGVTSAVQTQLNAKQETVSGVDSTEIGYLDGVTSAIQTQINAQIPKSTITAKGDLLVGTGSGTLVAQGVGANGTVLTANSAQADGVEWVAPGGALTLASIASGTLSGSTVVTSSLTQDFIQVTMSGITLSTAGTIFIRLNGATTNYNQNYWGLSNYPDGNFTAQVSGTGGTYIACTFSSLLATGGNNSFVFTFQNCKQAGITTYSGSSTFQRDTQSNYCGMSLNGHYNSAAAITSITIGTTAGTFSAGSYKIIGA
jgi:hypothetical protein